MSAFPKASQTKTEIGSGRFEPSTATKELIVEAVQMVLNFVWFGVPVL